MKTSGLSRAAIVLLVALPSCLCFQPPGKGRLAEQGYARAAPVIAALEKFHDERKEWPDSLGELVPAYLASVPPIDDLAYRRTPISYELEFHYSPPGMNHCVYTPAAQWKCSGYY